MITQGDFGCKLCGNMAKEPDKECPECHADFRFYYGIPVGYVYPEEYERFKELAKRVLVIGIVGLGTVVSVFLWMVLQIKKLGF